MDVVALGLAKADAKKNYTPIAVPAAGGRTHLHASTNTLVQVGTSATMVAATERTRRSITVTNRSGTSQNLMVGFGTLDSNTVPGSGFDTVPVGQEWTTTDVRPVFAYYVTSADLIQVRKEVSA